MSYNPWDHKELAMTEHAYMHTDKGFSVVYDVDVFLEFCCFFYDPSFVGYLISGFSAFSKPSLSIWKSMLQGLLKPSLENFEH